MEVKGLIGGIMEIDYRGRVYFPNELFEFLGNPKHINIVKIEENDKDLIAIQSDKVKKGIMATISANVNDRRAVIPKNIRNLLSLNQHNRYIVILNAKIKNNNFAIMKRLDIDKVVGD